MNGLFDSLSNEDISKLYGLGTVGQDRKPAGTSEEELKEMYLKEMWENEQAEIAEENGEDFIIDESHPALMSPSGVMARAVFKNFSPDSDTGFNYLQKQFPDLEWKKGKEGEVLVRDQTQVGWRRLDPSSLEFQDISDVLTDIGMGLGETVGSAAGGITGALGGTALLPGAGTVAGGLTGAATGGALAATGLEAGRQKLGHLFGMDSPEGLNTEKLKQAAIYGAASPLFFGTGAVGKNVAKSGVKGLNKLLAEKAAQKVGGQELAKEYVLRGQSGIPMQAIKAAKGGVKGGVALAAGIDKPLIDWAEKNIDLIEHHKNTPFGREEIMDNLRDTLIEGFERERSEVGNQIGRILADRDEVLDMSEVIRPFDDLMHRVRKNYEGYPTKENAEALRAIETVKNRLFTRQYKNEAGEIITEQLETSPIDSAMVLIDTLNSFTKVRTMPEAAVEGATKQVTKPNTYDKALRRAAAEAVSNLTFEVERALGPGYKDLKTQYGRIINAGKVINKYFKDDNRTQGTLMTYFSPRKAAARREIMRAADTLGEDVQKQIKDYTGIGIFSKPDDEFISTTQNLFTPQSGLMGSLSYFAARSTGMPHEAALVAAAAGAATGNRALSPPGIAQGLKSMETMATPYKWSTSFPAIPTALRRGDETKYIEGYGPGLLQTILNIDKMDMHDPDKRPRGR